MVIEVLGLSECLKKFENIGDINVMPVIKDGTLRVQLAAKKFAPVYGGQNSKAKPPLSKSVIKGELRRSIHVLFDKSRQIGYVTVGAAHAIYQEFGTRFQVGTPFLSPAMKAEKAGIMESMEKYIREQIAKQKK